MNAALTAKLATPHTTDDWLDRRAGLEAEERAARNDAKVNAWLDKYYSARRRGGQA